MAAQRLFHSLGQGVGLTNWQIGIHLDRDVAVNAMSDAACADVAYSMEASYMRRRVLDLSENLWLDAVDQASPNRNRCIFDDQEYGDGDRDANDWVKDRHAQGDTDDTNEHRQAGESINAGVLTIGDQRGRADFLAHADAKDCYRFIANTADEGCRCYPPEVLYRLRVEDLHDRFMSSSATRKA